MTVKETVLSCLEQNRGEIVSGQQLADTAQVSRSAVWKAIHQLTQEGHQITVLPHKGYRLEQDSDRLSTQAIRQALDSPYRDIPLFLFNTIDSTNQEANRRLLDQAQHRTVILSEEQTQGRGRLGRSFYSPPSTGLYFSAILKPNLPLEQVGCLTVAAANAVCRGLEELGVKRPGIKWVNDIYVNGKKVCGILTEGSSHWETGVLESAVVGIGINVSTLNFPEELQQKAGSVFLAPGLRSKLAGRVLSHLFALTEPVEPVSLMQEYKSRCIVLGKTVRYQVRGEEHLAKAVDINETGNLVVEENGVRQVLSSGEISVRPAAEGTEF